MGSVMTFRLWVIYSTISLRAARFTSFHFRSLRGSETKSKRTQHWRSFWMNSFSCSAGGTSRKQKTYRKPKWALLPSCMQSLPLRKRSGHYRTKCKSIEHFKRQGRARIIRITIYLIKRFARWGFEEMTTMPNLIIAKNQEWMRNQTFSISKTHLAPH